MKCEDFEEQVSAYLEGELDESSARSFEQHRLVCSACSDLVEGVQQVRGALRGLQASGPPADFDLRLPSSLRDEIWHEQHAWAQPLALGLAVLAALMIVLWPVAQPEDEVAAYSQFRSLQSQSRAWAPVPEPRLADLWSAGPDGRQAAAYSHARARTVSY